MYCNTIIIIRRLMLMIIEHIEIYNLPSYLKSFQLTGINQIINLYHNQLKIINTNKYVIIIIIIVHERNLDRFLQLYLFCSWKSISIIRYIRYLQTSYLLPKVLAKLSLILEIQLIAVIQVFTRNLAAFVFNTFNNWFQ